MCSCHPGPRSHSWGSSAASKTRGESTDVQKPVGRLKFLHIAKDSSLGTRSGWLSDGEHTVEYLIGTKLHYIDSVG